MWTFSDRGWAFLAHWTFHSRWNVLDRIELFSLSWKALWDHFKRFSVLKSSKNKIVGALGTGCQFCITLLTQLWKKSSLVRLFSSRVCLIWTLNWVELTIELVRIKVETELCLCVCARNRGPATVEKWIGKPLKNGNFSAAPFLYVLVHWFSGGDLGLFCYFSFLPFSGQPEGEIFSSAPKGFYENAESTEVTWVLGLPFQLRAF